MVDLYNAGKPKREIMDEYDLGKSTVEVDQSINATGSPRAAMQPHARAEPDPGARAREPQARMEVDVLKQAALIYARK